MSVFDDARDRASYVREAGGSETVARLVHSATLGNSMIFMVEGAIHDGHLTRREGELSLQQAAKYMQDFERNVVVLPTRK